MGWPDAEAERKRIAGAPLEHCDWQGGHLWVIDLIVPRLGHSPRIVHSDFDADGMSRVWTGEAYLDRLGEEGRCPSAPCGAFTPKYFGQEEEADQSLIKAVSVSGQGMPS